MLVLTLALTEALHCQDNLPVVAGAPKSGLLAPAPAPDPMPDPNKLPPDAAGVLEPPNRLDPPEGAEPPAVPNIEEPFGALDAVPDGALLPKAPPNVKPDLGVSLPPPAPLALLLEPNMIRRVLESDWVLRSGSGGGSGGRQQGQCVYLWSKSKVVCGL